MSGNHPSSAQRSEQVQPVSCVKLEALEAAIAAQRWPETAAPVSGNTGAESSPEVAESPAKDGYRELCRSAKTRSGGVDWLELSLYGGFAPDVWGKLVEALEEAKQESIENQQTLGKGFYGCLGRPEEGLAVLPNSVGRGIVCKWGIRYKGMTIGIKDTPHSEPGRPSIRVTVPSDSLMVAAGHREVWEDVQDVLKSLGWRHERATVSRIDFCADLVGLDVKVFCEAFAAHKVIRRARVYSMFGDGRRATGLSLGRGMMCRIYDKVAEAKRSPEKLAIMMAHRWGGIVPEKATRVEFQMRREELLERLPDNEIDTVFDHLAELAEWASGSWLRFTDRVVDFENKNHQRAQDSKDWKAVQGAFAWAGEATKSLLKPLKPIVVDAKALARQAIGCLSSLFAQTVTEDPNEVVIVRTMQTVLMDFMEDMKRGIEEKRQWLRVRSAIGPPIDLAGVPF